MKGPDKTHLPLLRRKKVTHTTGYLRMKDDAARKFLASILTLVITAIPTWQSQHAAYIAARLKLITRLQKETILAALINDHERRHGQKITTYHDPRYFLLFELSANDSPSATVAGTFTPTKSGRSRTSDGRFTRTRANSDPNSSPDTKCL